MFKSLIIAAALAASAPNATASEDQQYCINIESLARTIMEARQRNASMTKVIQIMRESFPGAEDLMDSMVMQAYEKPAYSTEEFQQREIDDYANHWARLCYMSQKRKP